MGDSLRRRAEQEPERSGSGPCCQKSGERAEEYHLVWSLSEKEMTSAH